MMNSSRTQGNSLIKNVQITEVFPRPEWRRWKTDSEPMLLLSWHLLEAGMSHQRALLSNYIRISCPIFRLLLHSESPDGSVIPIWEEVDPKSVSVLKEVMSSREHLEGGVALDYTRIPITAERPPDFSDLTELINVVIRNFTSNTPIVVNCQLGRGRSTLTSVGVDNVCG